MIAAAQQIYFCQPTPGLLLSHTLLEFYNGQLTRLDCLWSVDAKMHYVVAKINDHPLINNLFRQPFQHFFPGPRATLDITVNPHASFRFFPTRYSAKAGQKPQKKVVTHRYVKIDVCTIWFPTNIGTALFFIDLRLHMMYLKNIWTNVRFFWWFKWLIKDLRQKTSSNLVYNI